MATSFTEKLYTIHGTGRDQDSALGDLERAVVSTQVAIGSDFGERVETMYEVTLFVGGKSVARGNDKTFKRAYSEAKRVLPRKTVVSGQLVTVSASYRIGAEKPQSVPDGAPKPACKGAGGGPEEYSRSYCDSELF